MTFDQWWHGIGSGIVIAPDHDIEEHTRYVTGICWDAARAATYEAEAAQLTQGLRAINADLLAALEYMLGADAYPADGYEMARWNYQCDKAREALKRAKGQERNPPMFETLANAYDAVISDLRTVRQA